MNSSHPQSITNQNQLPALFQPGSFTDAELLGRLLYPGKQKGNQRAEDLLQRFGGLRGLQIASRLSTDERKGLDDETAAQIRLTYELVRRQLKQSLARGISLTSPAMTMEYLQTVLRDRKREIFIIKSIFSSKSSVLSSRFANC